MSVSGAGQSTKNDPGGSLLAFFRREFGRPGPTPTRDLVLYPVAIAALAGLITGVWTAASSHFLDPAFVGYSIVVDVCIQIIILGMALAVAFITRRRAWSGSLFAIGFLCFLVIPEWVKMLLPGADYRLRWVIGALAAFQIARSVNRHLHRRAAAWLVGVPALVAVCALSFGTLREHLALSELPQATGSPNVLVIIVDTLRADHTSPYGYARDTSPYLTQLGQEGVVFDNAIAAASWTLPSHASMMTGLMPHTSKMEASTSILSGNLPNLGAAMSNRGYRTAAFSANYKFFNRDHGFIHGFSRFDEYDQTLRGVLDEVHLSRLILQKLSHLTTGVDYAFFGHKNWASAETIDRNALNWIGKGGRPFFLVLNFTDVHEPSIPAEPYLHRYTSSGVARSESMHFQDNCVDSQPQPFCDSERQQFIDTYDGSIRYVDDNIRNLLAGMNERGELKNTIVVFTSDHGQEFGDHGLYGHAKSLYRGEIQVPLIFWKPGLIPGAVRVPTPVSTSALAATILDLTGPDKEHALPGQSLAALWRSSDSPSNWPEPISELTRFRGFDRRAPNYATSLQSIVTPQWHYILKGGKQEILFDWKVDPAEQHDLSATQPEVCAALRARIQAVDGTWTQTH